MVCRLRRAGPGVLWLALVLFFLAGGRNLRAEHRPVVLTLHSYHIGLGWTDSIAQGIESAFSNAGLNPDIRYEQMDTKRISDPVHFQNLKTLFQHKYQNTPLDVIIVSDNHALNFLLAHGKELFPNAPAVFCGVNYFKDEMLTGFRQHVTGVVESISIRGTIDAALRLQPEATRVFVVTDDSVTGQANKKLTQEIITEYQDRLTFTFLEAMETTSLQERVSQLPDSSFVLWLTFTRDPAGHRYSLEEGCRLVADHSSAPLYGLWDFVIGNGAVGGLVTSGFAQGKKAGQMAVRILKGESPLDLPIIRKSPNRYIFDYTQMKRYRLDLKRLPPDTVVVNRPKTFYEVNKQWIWVMAGVIVGLSAIVLLLASNIHLRRKSEQRLRESKERFRGLFNNAQVGLIRARADNGQVLECNQKFADMIGYASREDCMAHCNAFDIYVNPVDRRQLVAQLWEKDVVENLEFNLVRVDGARFTANISSRWSEDRESMESVVTDITEKKRAEEENKALTAQLERSKKIEAVGLLAGGVAHDLNNILSGVVSYPDLLLMDNGLTDQQRRAVEIIQQTGLRAAAVVSDLLTLARGAAGVRKPLDINVIVTDYLNSPEFQEIRNNHPGMKLLANLAPDLFFVNGSALHIRKTLMNLTLNAAEALNDKGTVTVATKNRILEKPIAGYENVPPGRYAVLTIADTGPGLGSADLERIFEPFYTKKVMGKSGSGLGLTVVWNTIKDHGGYLTVDNGDKGVAFHLFFPELPDGRPQAKDLDRPADVKGCGETVLVVDDDPHQREIACEMLMALGYRPQAVSSGEEAVKQVQSKSYDLLMLDMLMETGMNGAQTFEQIAMIRPEQRAVIASGFAETEDVRRIQAHGTGTFIKKPYTRAQLGKAIQAELG